MKALQIETFGNPVEVVKAVDIPTSRHRRPAKW